MCPSHTNCFSFNSATRIGGKNIKQLLFAPGDSEADFVSHRQDPLQVLGAEGAGLPEGDAGGKALDDDRVWVVLDPLVRHLDGVLDAQCLPIFPVEEILDLLSQRVGQVDPGQLGLQTLCRQEGEELCISPFRFAVWFSRRVP